MTPPNRISPPEVLYQDTETRAAAFQRLAINQAAQDKPLFAVAATFAADIHVVQMVMWERVMVASPKPDTRFFEIAEHVTRSILGYASQGAAADDAAALIHHARQALLGAFDEAAAAMIRDRLMPLEHLHAMPVPTMDEAAEYQTLRLSGRTVEDTVAGLMQRARDAIAVAVDLEMRGKTDDAVGQVWQADWMTMEAYLLSAAEAVGDTSLVTAELRWLLVVEAAEQVPVLPSDFVAACETIRGLLKASLGDVEGNRLAGWLIPIGADTDSPSTAVNLRVTV